MANHLVLLKSDFFAHEQQAVAVADRYPQDVFAEHPRVLRAGHGLAR